MCEIEATISSNPPGYSAIDYEFVQVVNNTLTTYYFSDGTNNPVPGGGFPDGPSYTAPNYQNLWEIDAPGVQVTGQGNAFSYFKPNPPQAPGQPPNTTVTKITELINLTTQTIYTGNGSICASLAWYVEITVTGPDISHVTTAANTR